MKRKLLFLVSAVLFFTLTAIGDDVYVNGSFENLENTSGGLPSTLYNWNGDYSEIVGTSLGISPLEGSYMLQFKGTGTDMASSLLESLVWKLVDMDTYSDVIQTGNAVARASAYFNRVSGDNQTDTMFGIVLYAFEGDYSTFPYQFSNGIFLSRVGLNFETDGNLDTWEDVTVSLNLPDNTTFLALGVRAQENIYNDYSYPEFDGHFCDVVSLQIVPEPATVILLCLGSIGLLRKRKS